MPRRCTICIHPKKAEIDQALVHGEPYRSVARRYEASPPAVYRHLQDHLPTTLVKAHEASEVAHADNLLAQVHSLQDKALAVLTKAELVGDLRAALGAIREARGNLELLGKLTGELRERAIDNRVLVQQQFVTINEETVIRGLAALRQAGGQMLG